jgi:hypothetical protein
MGSDVPDTSKISHPPSWPSRSPFHLTKEQIRFYDENGYLILRQLITGKLLARLQAAASSWIDQGMRLSAGTGKVLDDDFGFVQRSHGQVMFRVNYFHAKGEIASLELLGCPQVLGLAESLCGPNFLPTYESMVFKQKGDGAAIEWHQDAIHPRNYRIFNFDLYIDPSRSGAGALRVIPGTQTRKQDFCHIADTYGWEVPESIEVEMESGDVLLHDVMVAHGSPQVQGKELRRTVYLEFRAAEEILEDGPWDRAWIERRMRLIPVALRSYRAMFPDAAQFQWAINDVFRPTVTDNDQAELRIAHEVHMPGAFCSAGDAGGKT